MDDVLGKLRDYVVDSIQSWVCTWLGLVLNYMNDLLAYLLPYLPTIEYDLSFLNPFLAFADAFLPLAACVYCFKLYVSYRVFVYAYGIVRTCIPGF